MKIACHSNVWRFSLSSDCDIAACGDELYVYSDYAPEVLLQFDIIIDDHVQHLQKLLLHKKYRGSHLVWFQHNSGENKTEPVSRISKQISIADLDETVSLISALKQSDIVTA
jgi:hypothetical protein